MPGHHRRAVVGCKRTNENDQRLSAVVDNTSEDLVPHLV
jgi:hypothetical protein